MNDIPLLYFPCIVVIEKVPNPLVSWEADDTLDTHKPPVIIADPPTKFSFANCGSRPMSLETAKT